MPVPPYRVGVSLVGVETPDFLVQEGFDEYWDGAERISTLIGEEYDRLLASREWDEASLERIANAFDEALMETDNWELGSAATVSFGAFVFSLAPTVIPEEWEAK